MGVGQWAMQIDLQ
jgi:hypothetical protein